MKLRISKSFRNKLKIQVEYIAKDKPAAARKFKKTILSAISGIPQMPYKNRASVFFEREDIRDLIIKGYVVVYKVNKAKDRIEVFGFAKYTETPF